MLKELNEGQKWEDGRDRKVPIEETTSETKEVVDLETFTENIKETKKDEDTSQEADDCENEI